MQVSVTKESNMPYVKDILDRFKKQYGKDWEERYFAWQQANPDKYQKALATARQRGDIIVESLAKTKKGKVRAKKRG